MSRVLLAKLTDRERTIDRLDRERRELRSELDRRSRIHQLFPELGDLERVLAWASIAADPAQGRNLEGYVRASRTFPMPGAATARDRNRLYRFHRRLRELVGRFEDEMDHPAAPSPPTARCGKRECSRYDHRQRPGARYCDGCGNPLGASETPPLPPPDGKVVPVEVPPPPRLRTEMRSQAPRS